MLTEKSFRSKRFKTIGIVTIATVYFLILVGGIVRSTGSGMGCPDWPKCFGSWVPPTHIDQLPDDYLEVYKEKRIAKNKKVAGFLDDLGFTKAANELFLHPAAYIETEFNATKTWIEYLNRVTGVITGILIFLTLVYSFDYWKHDKSIVYLSFFSFLLVGFEGWLGSLVVSSNLVPEMITIHMALALVLVAVLIYTIARSQVSESDEGKLKVSGVVYSLLLVTLVFTFLQILLGTQVREQIDVIAFNLDNLYRDTWIDQLGISYLIHRSFSIAILLVHVVLAYYLVKTADRQLIKLTVWMLVMVAGEIVTGIIMAYFSIPAVLQPVHLLLASLLFGFQFLILIGYYYKTRMAAKPDNILNTVKA